MTPSESPKKKVLMICYQFPPDMGVGSLRSRKYAQYLEDFGWECSVLTRCFGRDRKVHFPGTVTITSVYAPDLSQWLGQLVRIVQSLRRWLRKKCSTVGSTNNPSAAAALSSDGMGMATQIQRMFLLPDTQFLWILAAIPFALWKQRDCRVIYTSAWPVSCHVLGLLVHKLTGKPWVADYRDEWTLNTQWLPPTRFHRWLGEKLDAACVRNARFVVNTTEIRTQNFIHKFGGNPNKYVTIHNGYDQQDIAPYLALTPPAEVLTLTSIGSLYGGRDPRPLLNTLADCVHSGLIDKQQLLVRLIGVQSESLQSQIDQLGISECVHVIPRIPQLQAFEHLAQSHIALLIGSEMERYAMTTKLYEYVGMGKKIFALVPPGPVQEFVVRCGGICAMYNDTTQIKQALMVIFDQFRQGLLSQNSPPNQTYERRNLAGQFAALLDACLTAAE
ncbi:MAG TPA: hypothetical protein P5175_11145 [Anaerohalosphaeraceae bacterium]|nr:hypothetical protein [Anaerohalosphaeraceae bacterium]HPC65358.1 hypothetical protein [Anaerohalosphaeraceae bacterium]HPO70365.1 hypothetical protein [Anaerohalosphaeraceae bacterium]HRS72389.1 hypothetical protein [Anaerohalosphaeraceae bacterium]